ncbi:tetratricopeptide repeat protein, partial [Deltaproteobacteria bacterium]|nr:tetratricopeptide repeat protein [Deltaproteobacteria bacterium]
MGKHLENYSLHLKIIPIIFLITFLLFTCAKEDPWVTLSEQTATLYQQGQYSEATEVAEEALQLAEKTFGPEHANVATSLDNLAAL